MFFLIRIVFLVLLVVALLFTVRYLLGGNPLHLKYAVRTLVGILILGVLLGLGIWLEHSP